LFGLRFACRAAWPWARKQPSWKGIALAAAGLAVAAVLYLPVAGGALLALHGLAAITSYEVQYAGADAIALMVTAGLVPLVMTSLTFAPGTLWNALRRPHDHRSEVEQPQEMIG